MTPHKQLKLWLKGRNVHNKETNCCVPDFSCCIPELAILLEDRQKFYKARMCDDMQTVDAMLAWFLSRLTDFQHMNANVIKDGTVLKTEDGIEIEIIDMREIH